MTSKVLCKFYMNGCCAYGDSCRFSHDRQDQTSQVCKYYLAGNCAYGDSCRYEHVKPEWRPGPPAGGSNSYRPPQGPRPPVGPGPGPGLTKLPSGADEYGLMESNDPNPNWDDYMDPDEMEAFELWQQEQAQGGEEQWDRDLEDPADIPLCSEYSRTGHCRKGDDCPLIHGDECEVCHRHALHLYNPVQREQHSNECLMSKERQQRLERDKAVDCCICLESVLGKPAGSGSKRFGLMECDHAFCLSCIRNWRASDIADIDTAVRTCPVCRTSTYFITPSTVWPESPEEKEAIVGDYKRKLADTHCMHFDFGEGKCPFGTSCFYKHAYKDGTLEVPPQLRLAGTGEGNLTVLAPVTLASFLDTPAAQRLLSGRRGRRS